MLEIPARADDSSTRPERSQRLRRRLLVGGLVVVVALVGAAYLVLRHVDGQYGPVTGGSLSGAGIQATLLSSDGGFAQRLTSTPGATAYYVETVGNNGSHSATIMSVQADSSVTDVTWAPWDQRGDIPGPSKWRVLPAVVPPGGGVALKLTFQRPTICQGAGVGPGTGVFFSAGIDIRWRSLFRTHHLELGDGIDPQIQLC
jgi:hypothetical protein